MESRIKLEFCQNFFESALFCSNRLQNGIEKAPDWNWKFLFWPKP